jgi:hypothetical protein
MQQQFLNLIRNTPTPLQPPVDNMDDIWSDYEKEVLNQKLGSSIIGGPEAIKEKLQEFLE